jgi:hypothetical protein
VHASDNISGQIPAEHKLLIGQHLPGGRIGGDHPGVVLHDEYRRPQLVEILLHGLPELPDHQGKALVAHAVGDFIELRGLGLYLFFAVAANNAKHDPGILKDRNQGGDMRDFTL